jgi:hypothetical protein
MPEFRLRTPEELGDHEPDPYLDYPEDHLWLRRADDSMTVIGRDRLDALRHGGAPQNPVEQLIADNLGWLEVYLTWFRGEWPVTITEGKPLPTLYPERLPP